ncbi:ABC transporter permease, partial [Streptosporangium sandarakinum]
MAKGRSAAAKAATRGGVRGAQGGVRGAQVAGAVITEHVFGLPGVGQLTYDAIFKADQPVV